MFKIFFLSYIVVVYPPPNSIQVLATERKELTVQWEWPNESGYAMECRLRLKEQDHDHLGNCMEVIYSNIEFMD